VSNADQLPKALAEAVDYVQTHRRPALVEVLVRF